MSRRAARPLILVPLLALVLLLPAGADAAGRTSVRVAFSDFAYKPRSVSLGSTGYVHVRWRHWNRAVAIGRGRGFATSSSVSPSASRKAWVKMFGRRRCGGRWLYTKVSIKTLGLSFTQSLGCTLGLHPGTG